MRERVYRFVFMPDVPAEEVEGSLLLALFAVESLHGEAQTRLHAAHSFDVERRVCVIDAATAVGHDLARIFTGFLAREFGADTFRVERVAGAARREPETAPAAT